MTFPSHRASMKSDLYLVNVQQGSIRLLEELGLRTQVKVPCRAETFQREKDASPLSPDGQTGIEGQKTENGMKGS